MPGSAANGAKAPAIILFFRFDANIKSDWGKAMTLECRIFKPSKNGEISLVETKTHEEILKTKKRQYPFNPHPKGKQKYAARMKNNGQGEKDPK